MEKQEQIIEKLNKLAEYEDLEEEGKLLKLPCKLGDTVYGVINSKIVALKVYSFSFTKRGIELELENDRCLNYGRIILNMDINKNPFIKGIFLTKEEARQYILETILNKDIEYIERD